MPSIPSLPSNFGPFNPSQDIGLFNPSLSCPDSGTRQFNDVTSFLRNLEHCQGLYRYRRTKLLEYMLWALNGPAWEWFKKQTHFNSLPRFGMALTKAFPSQEQRELESIAQKRAKRKARKAAERAELEIIETTKKTPKLQNIGTFDPSACNEPDFGQYSRATDFLQHLEQCQHLYRKSDLLALLPKCLCGLASEWFKTQSEFTSLKRFGRALAKAFPEASVRRAPRSSNLQLSTLDVIPESRENASGQQAVQGNCKIYKQSFNSNNELYEHIRNHEALKPAKDSHLSINAANLVCETKEKPSATHSVCRHCKETFNSKEMLRQHKREQHAKRPAVSSHLLIDAAKSACESVEISTANSSSSASLAVQSEQASEPSTPSELPLPAPLGTFNPARPHQDPEKRRFNQAAAFIQHLQQCQHLYGESELLEWMEVILCGPADTWFGNQPDFTSLHDFGIALTKEFPATPENLISNTETTLQTDSPERSSLLPLTLATAPEPTERLSMCRHCGEIFNSRESLRKHKSDQHPKKHVKSSRLENNAAKLLCTAEEKPVFNDSFASPGLQAPTATPKQISESALTPEVVTSQGSIHLQVHPPETVPQPEENKSAQCFFAPPEPSPQTFESEHQGISIQKPSGFCSSLTSEFVEKSVATCTPPSQESSIPSATPRNLITDTVIPLQPASPNCSDLSIATPKITSTYMESISVSPTEPAEAAKATEDLLAEIRTQAARIRVRLEAERAALQKPALESAPKSMERPSIQQIACARICRRCKQSFDSNNKLHEHIRQHHARKPVKGSVLRVPPRESAYEIAERPAGTCPPAPHAPPTPPATPKPISWPASISEPISPKGSRLPIATLNITPRQAEITSMLATRGFTPKRAEIAASNCPLTPPRTSVSKHQKPYLTFDDLIRMYRGKPRPIDLHSHRKGSASPQRFGTRPSRQPRFPSMHQSRITSYFMPATNQKPSISQGSKSSKPKSLDQHMSAESIRIAFSRSLPEKLANLPYKSADVSCVRNRPLQASDSYKSGSSKPRTPVETPSLILVLLRLLPAFLLALAFVSAISATKTGCINAYGQAVSAIGRAIR